MRNRIIFVVLLCMSLCVSCSSVYNIVSLDNNVHFLVKGSNVLVLTSEDGVYGSEVYKGSGLQLSRKIQSVLTEYQCYTQIDLDNSRFKDLEGRDLSEHDYIIVPIITHWEDRATSWSGIPDRISFSLFIYNNEGSLLTSTDIESKSAAMTFVNNDPSELIVPSLQKYFSKAF